MFVYWSVNTMKCKNCRHIIEKVSRQKDMVKSLFNGEIVHSNIGSPKFKGKSWAVICRVKKCGCLKPEPEAI